MRLCARAPLQYLVGLGNPRVPLGIRPETGHMPPLKNPRKNSSAFTSFPFLTLNTDKTVIPLKWKSVCSGQLGGLEDHPAETTMVFTRRLLWPRCRRQAMLAGGGGVLLRSLSLSIAPRSHRLGAGSPAGVVCIRKDPGVPVLPQE